MNALQINAVKGLLAFGPACCALAARAGYVSFRAPGAKKSARAQLKIIKIPFKKILQHTFDSFSSTGKPETIPNQRR
jgi:hypothetical protein